MFLSFLKRFLPDVPRRCVGWGRGGVGMCGVGVGGGVGVVIFAASTQASHIWIVTLSRLSHRFPAQISFLVQKSPRDLGNKAGKQQQQQNSSFRTHFG